MHAHLDLRHGWSFDRRVAFDMRGGNDVGSNWVPTQRVSEVSVEAAANATSRTLTARLVGEEGLGLDCTAVDVHPRGTKGHRRLADGPDLAGGQALPPERVAWQAAIPKCVCMWMWV